MQRLLKFSERSANLGPYYKGEELLVIVGKGFGAPAVLPLSAVEIPKGSQTDLLICADDDVVQDLDFKQLSSPNQIPGHFDVRFRWRAAGGLDSSEQRGFRRLFFDACMIVWS